MALTAELLQNNTATSGLTAEQISAIVTLSQNDENTVIAQRVGELYGGLDADIFASSGIAKNGTEKTYDYAKRVIGEIKAQAGNASELQNQIANLNKEKSRLEKIIADGGGDAETKKQLKQAQADLADVTNKYAELQNKYDAAESAHAQALHGVRLDGELDRTLGGLKFKASFPEAVTNVIVSNAKAKIKGFASEFIDDGKGGQVLVFKDATGAIMKNPTNNLYPYTAGELLTKELGDMGILETGKQTQGAGTSGNGGNGGNGGMAVLDLSNVRTQLEADEAITKALLAQGLLIGSDEFQEAKTKAWTDNKVTELPFR